MKSKIFTVLLSLVLLVHLANGGPAAYGICQAGCAAIVVACYAAGGLVFGHGYRRPFNCTDNLGLQLGFWHVSGSLLGCLGCPDAVKFWTFSDWTDF
uniref:Ammonium_transp domain-containing protein n=1 Tax=Globodera pallida TaxID=36090 RepID=A0A183CAC7_GLOPA